MTRVEMELRDRILAVLRRYPDGEPVPLDDIASTLACGGDEIISAASELERRQFGDRDVISAGAGGATSFSF